MDENPAVFSDGEDHSQTQTADTQQRLSRKVLLKGAANDGHFYELSETARPLDVTDLTLKIFHAGDPIGYCIFPLPEQESSARTSEGQGRRCGLCHEEIEDGCDGLVALCSKSHAFHYACLHTNLLAIPSKDVHLPDPDHLCPACKSVLLDPVICPAGQCVICTDCWVSSISSCSPNEDPSKTWKKKRSHSVTCEGCDTLVQHQHCAHPVPVRPTCKHILTGYSPLDYSLASAALDQVVLTDGRGRTVFSSAEIIHKLTTRQEFLKFLKGLPRGERQLQPSCARQSNDLESDDPQMLGHCPACPATDGMCEFTYLPPLIYCCDQTPELSSKAAQVLQALRSTDVGLCLPLSKDMAYEMRAAADIDVREVVDAGALFLSTSNTGVRVLDGRHIANQGLSVVLCWWITRIHGIDSFCFWADENRFRWYMLLAAEGFKDAQNVCNLAHLCCGIRSTLLTDMVQCRTDWLSFTDSLCELATVGDEIRSSWPATADEILALVSAVADTDYGSILKRLKRTQLCGTLLINLGHATVPLCGTVDGVDVHVYPSDDIQTLLQTLQNPAPVARELVSVMQASRYGSAVAVDKGVLIKVEANDSMTTTGVHLFRKISRLCCRLLEREIGMEGSFQVLHRLATWQYRRGGSTLRSPVQVADGTVRCPSCRSPWRGREHTVYLEWTMLCSVHLVCSASGKGQDFAARRRQILYADCMPFSMAGLFSHSFAKTLLSSYSIFPNLAIFNKCLQVFVETPGQVAVLKPNTSSVQFMLDAGTGQSVNIADAAMNFRLAPRRERNGEIIKSLTHNILIERTLKKSFSTDKRTCLLPCASPADLSDADIELGLSVVYSFLNICYSFSHPEARDIDEVTERNVETHARWLTGWLIGSIVSTNGGCRKIPILTGKRVTHDHFTNFLANN